jgi:2-polyprenyl-3-methyl-5-hydroxy-6-metoxy-1,4-benzoquinol methylase
MKNFTGMLNKLNRVLDFELWRYQLDGLVRRSYLPRSCPACACKNAGLVDRKGVHRLYECISCHLLYRFPGESKVELDNFYQADYAEPGLTTHLPSDQELAALIESKFIGSPKDFSYHIKIFGALGLKPEMRILDYGANWGYAAFQFREAGFSVDAFELSRKRAAFGKKLGLNIETNSSNIKGGYDLIYSCHVLEHVSNPRDILWQQMRLLNPNGLIVAHTPNGSSAYRKNNPKEFRKSWGRVHPILLTDKFIAAEFSKYPTYISSDDRPEVISMWNRHEKIVHSCDESGFFFAICNMPLN